MGETDIPKFQHVGFWQIWTNINDFDDLGGLAPCPEDSSGGWIFVDLCPRLLRGGEFSPDRQALRVVVDTIIAIRVTIKPCFQSSIVESLETVVNRQVLRALPIVNRRQPSITKRPAVVNRRQPSIVACELNRQSSAIVNRSLNANVPMLNVKGQCQC